MLCGNCWRDPSRGFCATRKRAAVPGLAVLVSSTPTIGLFEVRNMPTKPNMTTHSVKDLQVDAAALIKHVGETRQPIRIKANGHPPVVVLDEETYDHYIHLINLGKLLNEGLEDVRQGRTRPLEEFLREFEDAKKISRRHRPSSAGGRRAHS
jgi:PHD/YefM family antitoxin component YafN of YafNO toxin-antitoxin module